MSRQYCVECGAGLNESDRFCTACGAAKQGAHEAQEAETGGLTENAEGVVDWPTETQVLAPARRRRRKLPLLIGAGAIVALAVAGAAWFLLLRPAQVSAAQSEQKNLDALISQLAQASSLTEVSEKAAAAAQRSQDLVGYTFTDSEDDLRLAAMVDVYEDIASLQGISAKDPSLWNESKANITGAINNSLSFVPAIVDTSTADQMLQNINDLTITAQNHLRKLAAYGELNSIAYEFKRRRDALDPYFTRSSTGEDMYYALQDKPAEWRDMQSRLQAIDTQGAPGVAAVRDELDAALARGASGIDDFLYAVPNSYSCRYKCWRAVWDSTAGRYSAANDDFMKSLLRTQLPRLKKRLDSSAPE